MSSYQFHKRIMQNAMNQLFSHPLATFFSVTIDPVRDGCANYFDIISDPMDLGTIQTKIQNDQYISIDQWKEDIEKVWKNALKYHGESSTIGEAAKYLKNVMQPILEGITYDYLNDWQVKLDIFKEELNRLLKNYPKGNQIDGEKKERKPHITSLSSKTPAETLLSQVVSESHNDKASENCNDTDITSRIIVAVNNMDDSSDQDEVYGIIKGAQPSLISEGENLIEFNDLSKETVDQIVSYLNSKGIKF